MFVIIYKNSLAIENQLSFEIQPFIKYQLMSDTVANLFPAIVPYAKVTFIRLVYYGNNNRMKFNTYDLAHNIKLSFQKNYYQFTEINIYSEMTYLQRQRHTLMVVDSFDAVRYVINNIL